MALPDETLPPDPEGTSTRAALALLERRNIALVSQGQPDWLTGEEEADSLNLRAYWVVVMRRKWTVLTVLAIVVVAALTATYLTTPIYRATTTLQIDADELNIVKYEAVTAQSGADVDAYLRTQHEVLRSRANAERVVNELNLIEHPAFNRQSEPSLVKTLLPWLKAKEAGPHDGPLSSQALAAKTRAVVATVQGGLRVEPVGYSRLLRLHFDSPDAKLAADVTNSVARVFINLNLSRRMDATSYAKTFLQDQLQQTQAKLEQSEKALVAFARQEQLIKPGGEADNVDTSALQGFAAALNQAQQERIRAESLYNSVQGAAIHGLPEVLDNKTIQNLKERKATLDAEYQEGLKLYKPGYPKMELISRQMAEVGTTIDLEIRNVRSVIKARYQAALALENALTEKLKESRQNILGEQDRSIQYNILKREVETNRQLYEGLLQRLKEVGVAGGVGINNISVIDAAEVPRYPHTPKPRLNLLIAIFVGLFGGIGLAFLLEHLDDTIKRSDDLEQQLGLPVLGVIPNTDVDEDRKLHLENLDVRSHFAEAYRSLRTALQFSTPQGMPRVLMVTSTSMAEGKSTTALSLAMQIAQMGKTVLLIDGDLRKASLHGKLELPNDQGLTNYLAGDAKPVDITRRTDVANLFAITSGPLPPNPAELIASSKMVALLALAAEKFDQVIIDGPPVLGLADAPLLGSIASATVMVVESGSTRREFARGAIKRLRGTRTHVLGGVLTKVRAHGESDYYSGHYYQYGESPA
jgi:capsular exopolysaccharide synthesis family protein